MALQPLFYAENAEADSSALFDISHNIAGMTKQIQR